MTSPTYIEIASDYRLWMEYIDTAGIDTEAAFTAMSVERRLQIIVNCVGPEVVA